MNLQVSDITELEHQEFTISNADVANWAVEKIKEERARRDLFVEAAQGQIERLDQQVKDVFDKCAQRTGFLLVKLDEYLESVPAKQTKTQKSLDLPAGKLIRKLPSADYVRDDKRLIEVLVGTGFVEMKPSLKWAELKKDIIVNDGVVMRGSTGEILDGISIAEKPAVFDVK